MPHFGHPIDQPDHSRGDPMDAAMERRVIVATSWVSTRIAVLDKEERYEDSYALTQEFCEWITCTGENDSMLERSVMTVPRQPRKRHRIS